MFFVKLLRSQYPRMPQRLTVRHRPQSLYPGDLGQGWPTVATWVYYFFIQGMFSCYFENMNMKTQVLVPPVAFHYFGQPQTIDSTRHRIERRCQNQSTAKPPTRFHHAQNRLGLLNRRTVSSFGYLAVGHNCLALTELCKLTAQVACLTKIFLNGSHFRIIFHITTSESTWRQRGSEGRPDQPQQRLPGMGGEEGWQGVPKYSWEDPPLPIPRQVFLQAWRTMRLQSIN